MAKVTFTAMVADVKGKLAGTVFSKNRAGNYVRTKVTPSNARTTAQQAVRGFMTTLAQGWRALGASSCAAWNAAAAVDAVKTKDGNAIHLTGMQYYMELNRNLAEISATTITSPPAVGGTVAMTSIAVSATKGTPSLSVTFAPAATASEKIILYATEGLGPGQNFFKNKYRKIGVLTSSDSSPFDALADYTAKYGTIPTAGYKIGVMMRSVKIATGRAGGKMSATCIVGA
jgi:hypothetical protein